MSEVWPFDTKKKNLIVNIDQIREFKCLLLMPFEKRFDQITTLIKETGNLVFSQIPYVDFKIERLDWVDSTNIIQSEIWQKIIEADLIFCDITGYNPNVMYELGVAAAWKDKKKVALLKDKYLKMVPMFDIQPARYIEYELVSEKKNEFIGKISKLFADALISFPDEQSESLPIKFPLEINFNDGKDDSRIYTPPIAHRLVKNGYFEFGALHHFPFSWASIGKEKILNSRIQVLAKFSIRKNETESGFIGVGLRSSHYYGNFANIVYLNTEGGVVVTIPNETPPKFYDDIILREATKIDPSKDYLFDIKFDSDELLVNINDFSVSLKTTDMPKVFGPGLIRLQCSGVRMCVKSIKVEIL